MNRAGRESPTIDAIRRQKGREIDGILATPRAIRPDGDVGFRSQPAGLGPLSDDRARLLP